MMLTEFLLARIAEDERVALAAAVRGDAGSTQLSQWFDPATMLAECRAKRRIVELHSDGMTAIGRYDAACHVDGYGLPSPDDCYTLRILAAVNVDHPDYRDEWKP